MDYTCYYRFMKGWLSKGKWWLLVIVTLALIFRAYNFQKSFSFAHDQDLYSWIAKDIVVNHHQRLVGQITSVDGVFIGSFYYYLMAVFYGLFGMNPLSAAIPVTIIGMFNLWSIYWVIKKHYGGKAGTAAAIIYAFSYGIVSFDRWSVPTEPTITWSIWFLEVILEMRKGNLKWLPLYGFLVGFTWQLHIALLPVLPLPIVAYFVGKNDFLKIWQGKQLKRSLISIAIFLLTLSPFLLFEVKHNFSQVKSIMIAQGKPAVGPTGVNKFIKVVDASGREFQQRLLIGNEIKKVYWYWIVLILMSTFLVAKKKVSREEIIMFSLWYFLIMLAQFTSKRIVSEYYFTNLLPIYLVILSLFLTNIKLKKGIWLIGAAYFLINGYWLITRSDVNESYFYRVETVDYIKKIVEENNYPCISVNYIADPGVGVGFRYLFWYRGVKTVRPGTKGVPAFNIVIPWQISQDEEAAHFGRFGITVPEKVDNVDNEICTDPANQLDPLLGYTE